MKTVKMVLQHNINNFVLSVSLYCHLYKEGSVSSGQLFFGLVQCVRERAKLYHWSLPNL